MQVMMQVGFYGHVRQYKNIQSEIDANIKRVLESERMRLALVVEPVRHFLDVRRHIMLVVHPTRT